MRKVSESPSKLERDVGLHRFLGQWIDDFFGVKILLAIRGLLEKLSRTVSKQLMVCYLKFKGSVVPGVVQVFVIRVNESQLFVRRFGSQDVLRETK